MKFYLNEHKATVHGLQSSSQQTGKKPDEGFGEKEHEATHESDLSSDDDFEVNYSKFKCIDCNLTFSSEDNFKVHMSLNHDWS